MARKYLELRSIPELAMEYVILVNGATGRDVEIPAHDDAWPILQEMLRRVGTDHTNTHLDQARETYRMVIPKEKPKSSVLTPKNK